MPPRLVGDGPATCSTSLEIERVPVCRWDANRYYRDLGVSTTATRREVKQAYLDGPRTVRRTFVVKQLLDPVVRRSYDMTPLGSVFLDEYVLRSIQRRLALRATPGASPGGAPIQINSRTPLDTVRQVQESPSRSTDWPFAFYLWGTDRQDKNILARWQERLVSALGKDKHHLQVAVGLRGGMGPAVETTVVGRRIVVFLHEDEDPTDALARVAAASLIPSPPTEMSSKMQGFRKGADEAANASKGVQFAKTHYLSIEDGKQEIVRFLTDQDDWIVVDQHNNITTKGAPPNHDGNWPAKMGAVCRGDVAFTGGFHDGSAASRKAACYICSNHTNAKGKPEKPSGRTWALACLREQVIENGQIVGVRDKTREVAEIGEDGKPTGNTKTERAVVVVNMGYKNFFSALNGFAGHFGTVLDRDYLLKRKGSDETTIYNIIPLDPIFMGDGTKFDTRNPEHAAKYEVKPGMLEDIVMDRASDEFYARFFDKTKPFPSRDGQGGGSAPQAQAPAAQAPAAQGEAPAAQPVANADQGRLDALAGRIKGYGPKDGAAPEAAPEVPQQATPPVEAGGPPATAGEAPAAPAGPPAGGMRAFD